MEEMKVCSVCKENKPLQEFYKWSRSKDGHQNTCKSCCSESYARAKRTGITPQRRYLLKNKYGIEDVEYNRMKSEQDGVCAICGVPSTETKGLFVDHDHISGEVRGLLCQNCNFALGFMNDDVNTMIRAIGYILKYKSMARERLKSLGIPSIQYYSVVTQDNELGE